MGNRTPQDQSLINTENAAELRYWAEKWGVSAHQIVEAVRRVGPVADEVAAEIGELLYFSQSALRRSESSIGDA
jgi:hypothetical protein